METVPVLADHWLALARHTPLGIWCDLDGSMVPFARTLEEARPDDEVIELVSSLAVLPGVTMAIVSGRPGSWLETFFSHAAVYLVAEHGAARRGRGAWDNVGTINHTPLEDLAGQLETVARRHAGTYLERKPTTVAIHYRQVPRDRRGEFLIEAYSVIDAFVTKNPAFERLEGVLVVEVRPASVKKSSAVPWIREIAGAHARLLALGDDVTDEHMFRALDANDEGIVVRTAEKRRTHARWELDDSTEVRAVLQWIRGIRAGETPLPVLLPREIEQPAPPSVGMQTRDLLVV